MTAEILTIGDELLIGQIVNTNAAWIGERLSLLGVEVARMVTIGDGEAVIRAAIEEAVARAGVVIITGGLGPTHDDVTRNALARAFGVPLVYDEQMFEAVKERFAGRGYAMPESNRTQALRPAGFVALPNPVGTAPGLWRAETKDGRTRVVAALPGVPHEMKTLMEREVLPRLRAFGDRHVIRHKTLLTTGIGESHLQELIGDLSAFLGPNLGLAFLPSTSGVRLRITARGEDAEEVEERLRGLEEELRSRIGKYVFGEDDDTLEGVVGEMLRVRGLTIATAESCTGGLVCHRLTNVSGSSAYVLGGVVAYANAVKKDVLGVDPEALETYGAVSEAVARQMAEGARRRLGASVAVSTTGIMGPTGGTPEKPVGTVWVGFAGADGSWARRYRFAHDRRTNKALTSTMALNMVRVSLLEKDPLRRS
ncbi:competence/damage-inducible protein A [Rhodocaloribacter sp.]